MKMIIGVFGSLMVFMLVACSGGGSGSGSGNTQFDDSLGLTSCPANNQVFSVSPLSLDQVEYWQPLGHLNPPAHTFPTDHQYVTLYQTSGISPLLPLLAPGDIRVFLVTSSKVGDITDYSIYFQPCGDVRARFGHVISLTAELLAAAGSLDQGCSTYSPTPNTSTTNCSSRTFRFDLKAGAQMGVAKGIDFWLQDRRIPSLHFTNSSRFSTEYGFDTFHTVAASEYFTSSAYYQIKPKIGGVDPRTYRGSIYRNEAPLGGTIAVDVDGAVMGYWFNPKQPSYPESYHASLVPDSLLPDILQVFSVGVSQPNSPTEPIIGTFTPTTSGKVNRSFDSVTADGSIYCYEITFHMGSVFLLQLTNASTLRLEFRNGPTTCAQHSPYTFTANSFDYVR